MITAGSRTRLGVAASALVILGALVTVHERQIGPLPGEGFVIRELFRSGERSLVGGTAGFFAGLAAPPIALATVVLVARAVRREFGMAWAWLVPATLVAPALTSVAKSFGRPSVLPAEHGFGPVLVGLPSGHAAYAAAIGGLLAALAGLRDRRDLGVAALATSVAVALAVVADGAHLPGDALAGYLFGLGWLCALLCIRFAVADSRLRVS